MIETPYRVIIRSEEDIQTKFNHIRSNTLVTVNPNIVGELITLEYEGGLMIKAFWGDIDVTESMNYVLRESKAVCNGVAFIAQGWLTLPNFASKEFTVPEILSSGNVQGRFLDFLAYDTYPKEEELGTLSNTTSYFSRFYLLQKMTFQVPPFTTMDIRYLANKVHSWEDNYNYPVDGIMVRVAELSACKILI